jgi:ParB family transcriptional regulator, chromosome partitioning protein
MEKIEMSDDAQKPTIARPARLGRGLAALIGEAAPDAVLSAQEQKGSRMVPIEFVRANPNNPRKMFSEDSLVELTDSIREKGIIQPLVVRPIEATPGTFEIVAGERRWRSAQRVGLHEVPVVILNVDAREALELAIIENVQRADLNPLEEAAGYDQLIEQFNYTQLDLAKVVGKSRSHVANTMRLSKLPESVKTLVMQGDISAGHARALLMAKAPDSLAKRIIEQGLTVRDIERLIQTESQEVQEPGLKKRAPEKDADTRDLERILGQLLGLSVQIDHKTGGGGVLSIKYSNVEQLEAVCQRLKA